MPQSGFEKQLKLIKDRSLEEVARERGITPDTLTQLLTSTFTSRFSLSSEGIIQVTDLQPLPKKPDGRTTRTVFPPRVPVDHLNLGSEADKKRINSTTDQITSRTVKTEHSIRQRARQGSTSSGRKIA